MGRNIKKIAALTDLYLKTAQDVNSPQIRIEPYEEVIDCAVKVIQAIEPNYFQGIETIKVMPSSAYGHVSSDEPSVINVNIDRIKNELQNAEGRNAVAVAAAVIAHERGHVSDFSPETGFPGGEGVAENEERRMESVIEQNIDRLQNLPCFQKWNQ